MLNGSRRTVFRSGFGIFTNLITTHIVEESLCNLAKSGYGAEVNPPFSLTPLPITNVPVTTDTQWKPFPPRNNTKPVPPKRPLDLGSAAGLLAASEINAGRADHIDAADCPHRRWRIYKVVGSVKRNRVVGPGWWFASIRWPGSTTHLFDPARGP